VGVQVSEIGTGYVRLLFQAMAGTWIFMGIMGKIIMEASAACDGGEMGDGHFL
jgi:hypothetical protein